jgi:hypothetical protein
METNLVLAEGDSGRLVDLVDEVLTGLMLEEDLNIAPKGSRRVDSALSETIWNDDERGTAQVRLIQDSSIPAQWIAVQAKDGALLKAVVARLADVLPILSYDVLRQEAASGRGALTRLVLTHDVRLNRDLGPLVEQALQHMDPVRREDAVMAAQLAGMAEMIPMLERAAVSETDAGLAAMLAHALGQLAARHRKN